MGARTVRLNIISIHAPPRGATALLLAALAALAAFQFTPLREGRPFPVSESPGVGKISIHAPPRGATQAAAARRRPRHISIHAPPRGATSTAARGNWYPAFQFTPLREGRRKATKDKKTTRPFQFTPLREGRRQKICNFCKSFVQPLQISMA